MNTQHAEHLKVIRWLLLVIVLMYAFGFLLVPLYDVFCRITGINGKVTRTGPVAEELRVDTSRTVRIQLVSINNESMPWQFRAEKPVLEINPGRPERTLFIASNPTDRLMMAQAVPSIAPSEAAAHVQKINCFCFDQQQLAPNASIEMPMIFVVDAELPQHIRTITISYTLFDITDQAKPPQRASAQPTMAQPTKNAQGKTQASREMLL